MQYNPQFHHRRSIRLKGYDYSQAGAYFITLCTDNRKHLFGEIINGKMILNEAGNIVADEWIKTHDIRPNTELGEFIIMPDHFHAILIINYQIKNTGTDTGVLQYAPTTTTEIAHNPEFKSPSQTIGAIIRGFKGSTTKKINSTGVLQYALTRTAPTALTGIAPAALTGIDPTAPKIAPTTEYTPRGSIWQRNYCEHIIRNETEYNRICNYIINNPIKWKSDKFNGSTGNYIMEMSVPYGEEVWMI